MQLPNHHKNTPPLSFELGGHRKMDSLFPETAHSIFGVASCLKTSGNIVEHSRVKKSITVFWLIPSLVELVVCETFLTNRNADVNKHK
jgi:hypothetical protein